MILFASMELRVKMVNISLLVVLLFLLQSADAKLFTILLDSDIQNATLYGSGQAELNRIISLCDESGETVIPEGHHEVRIKGFQKSMEDQSIQLKISSSIANAGSLTVLDFKISTAYLPRTESLEYQTTLQTLQKEEKELNILWSDHNRTVTRVEHKLNLLAAYASTKMTSPVTTGSTSLSPEEALNVLEVTEKESAKLQTQLLELNKKSNDFQAHYDSIQSKLKVLINNPSSSTDSRYVTEKELYVHIHVLKPLVIPNATSGQSREFARLHIKYMVTPAKWSPVYEVHVKSHSSEDESTADKSNFLSTQCKIEIDYYAKVSQQTGEDWNNVQLTLSTSSPQHINDIPVPNTKGVYVQAPMRSFGAPMMKRGKSAARSAPSHSNQFDLDGSIVGGTFEAVESVVGMEDAMPVESNVMEFASVSSSADVVNTGGLQMSSSYQISHPVNVTSNSSPKHVTPHYYQPKDDHKLLIDKISLQANMFTFAVPSIRSEAYLVGFTQFPSDRTASLLPSYQMRLDIDDNHVGTSSFPELSPGDHLRLNLGVNRNIKITSHEIIPSHSNKEEDKSTWFVKDKKNFRVRTYERVFTIKSTYTTAGLSESSASLSPRNMALVILSENLPKSTEERDLKVDLASPSNKDFISLGSEVDSLSNDEFFTKVLTKEFSDFDNNKVNSNVIHHYQSKSSGNLFWALWINPKETKSFSFKYQIISPEEKEVVVM